MLNVNKLALTAARRVVLEYKDSNKRLFNEYKEAYINIKLAVNNGYHLDYTYNNNNCTLTLYFSDENENTIEITFREYTERRVAEAFRAAYMAANDLNILCFDY